MASRPTASWSTATTWVDAEREPSIVTVGIRRLISSVAALPAITGTASTMPSTACSARRAIESAIDSGAERSRRRDAHAVAGRARGAFHAVADDGARVVHGGHADDADDAAAARREHARGGIAPVAELRDRGLDLRARVRGDVGVVAERAGDGLLRDAGEGGDVSMSGARPVVARSLLIVLLCVGWCVIRYS